MDVIRWERDERGVYVVKGPRREDWRPDGAGQAAAQVWAEGGRWVPETLPHAPMYFPSPDEAEDYYICNEGRLRGGTSRQGDTPG